MAPVNIKKIPVNRNAHFAKIKASLNVALNEVEKQFETTKHTLLPIDIPKNIILTFKDNPDVNERLVLKSLDSHGMSLLSVKKIDDRFIANVSVPADKIDKLKVLVEDYGYKEQGKNNNPKNKALIESISEITFGDINAVWFGDKPLPEARNEMMSVELWIDISEHSIDEIELSLHRISSLFGITVLNEKIKFKDRLVKIIYTTLDSLEKLYKNMQKIAEIRPANVISTDFLDMKPTEQFSWSNSLTYTQTQYVTPICILDTGLNYTHPLLAPFSNPTHVIAVEPHWTNSDNKGHGTGIAGLAIYGDLKYANQKQDVEISSTIESVKILPDQGANDPRLYGTIITDAVYNIEAINPSERRIYAMAVTSEYNLRGAPSSWSAKIDELSSGTPEDDTKRLFVISAGNMQPQFISDYPDSNLTTSIEDPANSYNALSIGYWASENTIKTPGYSPVAELTDLGPTSTTSLTWETNAPIKPEVVFEGGNFGFDSSCNFSADLEELCLTTTSHEIASNTYFAKFGETSAATALAAKFISEIWSRYPAYWPETIRALVVHSANWPQKIYNRYTPYKTKQDIENLLRSVGYGYPDLQKAISSGDRSVNLVIEDQIQPYTEDGKLNKMVLYSLPWPENELLKLADEIVKLRITLSYFIEPNPGERGWENKYKYTSCGLRFETNSAGEESSEFVYRINKKFREDNKDIDQTNSDSAKWLLGSKLRSKGSIHSDLWSGTAAELSDKKYIAIYPVSGWWKDLKKEKRQSNILRYSLIVSIETEKNNIELHNVIENLIDIKNTAINQISI